MKLWEVAKYRENVIWSGWMSTQKLCSYLCSVKKEGRTNKIFPVSSHLYKESQVSENKYFYFEWTLPKVRQNEHTHFDKETQ